MAVLSETWQQNRTDAFDLKRLFRGQWLFGIFVAPGIYEKILIAAVCVLSLLAVWLLVWQSAIYVYVHLAYIPIAIAALFFGGWGGLMCGIAAGLLVGPIIPHDPIAPTVAGLSVGPDEFGWTFRLAAYSAFGTGAGIGFSILRKMTIRLLQKGYIDELTGLPNQQYMTRALNTLEASEAFVCVYAVQVGTYWRALATFGAEVAEELVRASAERLKEGLPETALLFRISESRLGIIAPASEFGRVEEGCGRVLNKQVEIDGVRLTPNAVIGKYTCDPRVDDPAGAIRCAVLAAYDAEESGIDLVAYKAASDDHYRKQLLTLSNFNEALETDQMYLVYQPKVALRDGRVTGCEALIRWRHPERGEISPAEFIPIVEQSGLIHDLTHWVVTEAARQAADWAEGGMRLPISVNVSANDLAQPGFIDQVMGIVAEAQVDHALLDIEVTESAAFQSTADVRENLSRIHRAGMGVSIDDYGTGMSSLYYLREIPATTLKIDQLFVKTLLKSEVDTLLVKSTIELCRSLGISTIAEGVEDEETAALLRDLGCMSGQGYYFARPLPPDDLVEFCRSRRTIKLAANLP